jgi:hypothetical protein
MELIELHIHQRHAAAKGDRESVPGAGHRIRRHTEDAAEPAGGPEHALGMDRMNLTGAQLQSNDAARAAVVADQEIEHVELVEKIHFMLDPLLIERLQDHVPGAVGGVASALDRALAEVPGVPSEPALIHEAVRRAVERQAHVLELEHRINGFAGKHLRRILVDQVVAALDGVEHVPLPVVFFDVAEGRADTALCRAGVRPRRVELADDGNIGLAGHLDGRHQAGPAGTNDDRVVAVVCHVAPPCDAGDGDC